MCVYVRVHTGVIIHTLVKCDVTLAQDPAL